jgi:hypothetical protein
MLCIWNALFTLTTALLLRKPSQGQYDRSRIADGATCVYDAGAAYYIVKPMAAYSWRAAPAFIVCFLVVCFLVAGFARCFGSVASFAMEQEFEEKASFPGTLGCHIEEFVDEPILTLDVMPAQPPDLTLPDYVHRLIALNRSSRSLEFTKPLLSVHSPFDRAMVLLDDVVQILDGSVAAPAAERPFLLYVGDSRAVNWRQIRVDDAGLRMR